MDRTRNSRGGGVRFLDPYPKYLQIREILARRIERTMRVGDRLPTEHDLRTEFGVSRETVREALGGLEADGVIQRVPGQGTFVAALPRGASESRFTGLSEDFSRFKLDTAAVVLFTGEVVPEASVASSLALPAGAAAFRIYRKRRIEREPFSLHEAFLPPDLGLRVVEHDLESTSVVDVLSRRLRLRIREHLQTIEAVAADTESARHLEVGIGAPLLQIVRHFKLQNGAPVVCFRSLYRSDRYFYTVALSQRRTAESDMSLPAVPPTKQAAPKRRRAPPSAPQRTDAARPAGVLRPKRGAGRS